VSHNPSMRLIVTALLESLKPMLNVLIVICLVWLMFAILAVNIVGQKLGYCNMNDQNASYYGISESQVKKLVFLFLKSLSSSLVPTIWCLDEP